MPDIITPKLNILQMGYDRWLNKPDPFYNELPNLQSSIDNFVPTLLLGSGETTGNIDIKDGYMQSSGFVSGSVGWRIDADGNLEANSGDFRGDISAATGTFTGGLAVGTSPNWFKVDSSGNIWSGNATLAGAQANTFAVTNTGALTCTSATIVSSTITNGTLTIGTGDSIFKADSNGIYLGNATFASAPFSVTPAGVLVATSGTVGGWTLGATTLSATGISLDAGNFRISVGASNEILIDGANKRIESSNYVSGVFGAGFHLDSDLLEVGNIACRGLIRTAVFQKDVVSVVGGNLVVLDGDVLDADMTALDVSTLTTKGTTTFAAGDLLRIKDGTDDEWLEVVAGTCDSYSEVNTEAQASLYNGWITKWGQSFTGDGGVLDSCKFYLKKLGSPTGNAIATIYAHTGTYGTTGKPTGAALATSDNFDVSTLTTSLQFIIFNFTGAERITLTNTTNYCVIIEYSGDDVNNRVLVGHRTTNPTHSGIAVYYYNAAWSNNASDTFFYVYTEGAGSPYLVNRDKASAYSADTNPIWKKGATVVNYKQSGDGGVYMTASDSNAPYLSIFDHAGTPWTTINTRLRIGNLNGYLGYSTDLYGIAIGETTKYLKYDTTNGLVIRGVITADTGYIGGATGWVIATGKITSTGIGVATSAGDATYAFWAGHDTPASAEFSVSHAGALVATSATITGAITATSGTFTGTINATAGKFGTTTNHWLVGATGLTAVSASTDVIINYGKTDFGQDATNGFILGYDYSASKSKFEIGSSATKVFKYDGTDFTLIGGTITAGTVRTAASGARVEMNGSANRLEIYNATPALYAYFGGSGAAGTMLYASVPSGASYSPFYITSAADANIIQLVNTLATVAYPSFVITSNADADTSVGDIVATGGATGMSSSTDSDVSVNTTGSAFLAIQNGTTTIYATNVAGCYCTKGGVWTDTSSKKMKENFEDITALDKLKTLDIKRYNYISVKKRTKNELKERLIDRKKKEKYSQTEEGQKGKHNNEYLKMQVTTTEFKEINSKLNKEYSKEQKRLVPKHISPMAEDMYKMFEVGDGIGLAAKDIAGVALQAIKELALKVEQLEAKLK